MKTRFLQIFVALATMTLIFSSCSKAPEYIKTIPKEAGLVWSIDMKSIIKKGKLDKLTETKAYGMFEKEMKGENKEIADMAKEILADPRKSGIDFSKDIFGFNVRPNEEEKYSAVLFPLSDSEKFAKLLSDVFAKTKMKIEIQKEEEFSYILEPNSKYSKNPIIAWDKEKLLILTPDRYMKNAEEKDTNLKNYMKKLFVAKKEDGITAVEDFNKFYKNKKDASLWLSSSFLSEKELNRAKKQMSFGLENMFLHTYLNFEDGEIDFSYDVFYNDEFTEMIVNANIMKSEIDTKLLEVLPEESLAFMGIGINPKKYLEFYKKYAGNNKYNSYDMFAKQVEKNLDVTLDEIVKSLSGDIVVSMSNLESKSIEKHTYLPVYKNGKYDYVDTIIVKDQLVPTISLVASIKDKAIFEKMLSKVPESVYEKKNNYYAFTEDGITIYFSFEDNKLILTNSQDVISGSLKNNLKGTYVKKAISKTGYYTMLNLNYEDYPSTVKEYVEKMGGRRNKKAVNVFLNSFDKLEITAKSSSSAIIKIELKSKKENSLYTVLNLIDENFEAFM